MPFNESFVQDMISNRPVDQVSLFVASDTDVGVRSVVLSNPNLRQITQRTIVSEEQVRKVNLGCDGCRKDKKPCMGLPVCHRCLKRGVICVEYRGKKRKRLVEDKEDQANEGNEEDEEGERLNDPHSGTEDEHREGKRMRVETDKQSQPYEDPDRTNQNCHHEGPETFVSVTLDCRG
jgi:hypothetical protein